MFTAKQYIMWILTLAYTRNNNNIAYIIWILLECVTLKKIPSASNIYI